LSSLFRRLPLLLAALVAVSLFLACEPSTSKREFHVADIIQTTVVVPPHDCVETRATLTPAMVNYPDLPATLYVSYEVKYATEPHDTLSDYVMTYDNWLAFDQSLPCTKMQEHHGSRSGDFWIPRMKTAGDYSFVLENRDPDANRAVHIHLWWGYYD